MRRTENLSPQINPAYTNLHACNPNGGGCQQMDSKVARLIAGETDLSIETVQELLPSKAPSSEIPHPIGSPKRKIQNAFLRLINQSRVEISEKTGHTTLAKKPFSPYK